jgi:hypothetical protein
MTQTPALLTYGPAARSRGRWAYVILAGAATTAGTLAASWAAEHYSKGDFTIMGLYACGILPVGPFLVGLVAATGYAGAALVTGVRIRRGLLVAVLGITVTAYCAMHYIEFRAMGPLVHRGTNAPVSFLQYYDLKTRDMRFVSSSHTPASSPPPTFPNRGPPLPNIGGGDADEGLGVLGYGVRALELLAFSAGSLCVPLAVMARTYCDLCERYHKVHKLAVVPAAAKVRRGFKTAASKARLQADHAAAATEAEAVLRRLTAAVSAHDAAATRAVLEPLRAGSKAAGKLLRHIDVQLNRCPQCGQGTLEPVLVTTSADGRNTSRNTLWSVRIDPAFGDALRPR